MSDLDMQALSAPFEASEIEWRIGRLGKRQQDESVWATCMAYVDARAVTHRLDLVCGPAGWKIEQPVPLMSENKIVGFLIGISIRVGDQWVTKWDGSDVSDIEAIKGGISGAVRRSCAMWGIGKYLYQLSEDFAQIVEKQPGAKYQPANSGKGTAAFYWMPPRLPAWALPGGTGFPPADAADNRGEESQVPQSRPQQQSTHTSAPAGGRAPMRECPNCGEHKIIPSKFGSGDYCLACKEKFPEGIGAGASAAATTSSEDTPW